MQGVERLGQAISKREEAEDANVLGSEQGDLFPPIEIPISINFSWRFSKIQADGLVQDEIWTIKLF